MHIPDGKWFVCVFSGGMIYKGKLEATQCGRTNFVSNSNNFYQFLILQVRTVSASITFWTMHRTINLTLVNQAHELYTHPKSQKYWNCIWDFNARQFVRLSNFNTAIYSPTVNSEDTWVTEDTFPYCFHRETLWKQHNLTNQRFAKCNTTLHSQHTSIELTLSSMQTYPKDYFSPWLLVWIQFINVISSNCFNVSFMSLSEIYYLKYKNKPQTQTINVFLYLVTVRKLVNISI